MPANSANQHYQTKSRLGGFEPLEARRVLDCHGISTVGICVPGDSNLDGQFDQLDFVQVLHANKYATDGTVPPADWSEGDWDHNGSFDQRDLVHVSIADTYLRGVFVEDLSSLIEAIPAHPGPFGPPVSIANEDQLTAAIPDRSAFDAVAKAVDFSRQQLLLFSWSGSGGDRLIAEPKVEAGMTTIDLEFEFGLTDDIREHQALLAISKDARWQINIEDGVVHEDRVKYEFNAGTSRLVVSGGFAGVHDEYVIDGSFLLERNADGSAAIHDVDATLSGSGLSSLDGQPLDSVLNLSQFTGLQMGASEISFSGIASSGYGITHLRLFVDGRSLTMRGGDFPPCCDFFQHEINAAATQEGI